MFTINVSNNGCYAVSGSEEGEVKIWDLQTYHETSHLTRHNSATLSAIFSTSNSFVISGSYDGIVKVWNLKAANELAGAALDGPVECIAMSSDETTILGGDRLGNVYCFEYIAPMKTTRGIKHEGK